MTALLPTEIELSAGPLTLRAIEQPSSGPVVLALHGYLDNAASMWPLAAFFPEYRFIALDMAGHGKSDHRPAGNAYNLWDYVQDIDAVVESQGWSSVILVGHSLGGIIASLYAAVNPHKVTAVASIDACGPVTAEVDETLQQVRQGIVSRRYKARSGAPKADLASAIQARCRVSDISPAHAELILTRNISTDAQAQNVWSSDPNVRTKSMLRLTSDQAERLMRAIECPIWFGAASNSFKKLHQVYPQREHWYGKPQIAYFEGGHHIHLEKTADVGRAIRQFVVEL